MCDTSAEKTKLSTHCATAVEAKLRTANPLYVPLSIIFPILMLTTALTTPDMNIANAEPATTYHVPANVAFNASLMTCSVATSFAAYIAAHFPGNSISR